MRVKTLPRNQWSQKRTNHSIHAREQTVREHLVTLYEQALRAWDLDGFKLDFVDSFVPPPAVPQISMRLGRLSGHARRICGRTSERSPHPGSLSIILSTARPAAIY